MCTRLSLNVRSPHSPRFAPHMQMDEISLVSVRLNARCNIICYEHKSPRNAVDHEVVSLFPRNDAMMTAGGDVEILAHN